MYAHLFSGGCFSHLKHGILHQLSLHSSSDITELFFCCCCFCLFVCLFIVMFALKMLGDSGRGGVVEGKGVGARRKR